MLENEKLKSKNGKIVTKEAFIKLNKHRNITNKCIELELNPKNRGDRESAEYLLDADNYDEEYDDEVYDDDYEDVDSGYRKNKKGEDDEDDEESDSGEYVIQYRTGYGGWIDGPGSNDERIAERLFDNFVSKEMMHRNAVRARLVKINSSGRVISVLGTS